MVSKSFQLNSSARLEDRYLEHGYELSHDEAGLTSDVQADPRTYRVGAGRRSESS